MFSMDSLLARFGPWIVVATIAVAAVGSAVLASTNDADSRVGGDFPSFYGAGSIVLDGRGSELYDAPLQQSVQSEQFDDGRFLYFAYPPFTAVPYAALARLPYEAGYALHSLLAIAALIGAVIAFRPFAKGMLDGSTRLGIGVASAVVMYPVLRSVLGGQNATFSLLLFVLVWHFDAEDRHIATGLCAAAMLYKPQFGLIVILVLVAGRRWRAATWAGGGAAVLYGLGAAVMGGEWMRTWVDAVTRFGEENLEVNGDLMVSALGWIQNLFGSNTATFVVAAAVVAAAAVPIAAGVVSRRWGEIPWYVIAPLVLLGAPSALYYDTALLLLTLGVSLAWLAGMRAVAVAAVIAVSWVQLPASTTGWSPLFLLVLAMAASFAVGAARTDRIRAAPAQHTR